MGSPSDAWMEEFDEASKLADDINGMVSEMGYFQRYLSSIRRRVTILGTRLDSLQSLLSKLSGKQQITEKEIRLRQEMLATLRSKSNQMASKLNISHFGNRDSLLGVNITPADAIYESDNWFGQSWSCWSSTTNYERHIVIA
ncbi:hypothetical protein Scep_005324 [Stephania cephalantha]|uniref:Uncharacterized protein n=1 Tax=Stephania cephalantha TaxID=152367 RepID=A0AAP0KUZ9_9MAGN